jgi:glycine/D-amino acid oxidase-like deaminating enzyme
MGPRPTDSGAASLRSASPMPYWFDDPVRPGVLPALSGPDSADLVVVGGGYLGLWTALLAKERDPERDVLLLEAATCGHAASGRNGGFCEASLTHGFGNGLSRWPDELGVLTTMGRENLDGIERTIEEHGIDCDFVRAGSLAVATEAYQVSGLREEYDATRARGMGTTWLDADELRERVDRRRSGPAYTTPTRRSSSRPGWSGGYATRACRWVCGSPSRHP